MHANKNEIPLRSCILLALLFLNSFWDLIDGGNNWSSCQLIRPQMHFVTRNEGLYLFKYNNFSRNEQYNVFAFWLNFMSEFSYRLFFCIQLFHWKVHLPHILAGKHINSRRERCNERDQCRSYVTKYQTSASIGQLVPHTWRMWRTVTRSLRNVGADRQWVDMATVIRHRFYIVLLCLS